MKIKILFCLAAAALLSAGPGLHAQPTNGLPPIQVQLHELVRQVQAKVDAGKKNEADFAGELKAFDRLIASEKTTNADAAAQVAYMKGVLYLQIIKNYDQAAKIFRQLKADYPDTKYGQNADQVLAMIEKQAAAQKIQDSLAPGAVFPDFAEKDLNGQPLSVGALKGKVVLVDFWATWCPPCRAELPNVIATYKKYHRQGFDIIGVSLDSDRAKLDAFLKQQDGMTWPQYFDGQGWSNKLAVKYGVEAIPFAVLVGPDGKILGKDLRGEELETAVAAAVAKK